MDKRNLAIFVLIGVVLILGFLQISQLINNESNEITNKITGEVISENILNKTNQDIEEELIIENNNFTSDVESLKYTENQIEECEEPEEGIRDRDSCYRYYAVNRDNYIYCEQIIDDEKRDSCYFGVAVVGNASLCELISTNFGCTWINGWNCKDACYLNIAIKSKVEFYCGNIESYEKQIKCVEQIPKEESEEQEQLIESAEDKSTELIFGEILVEKN